MGKKGSTEASGQGAPPSGVTKIVGEGRTVRHMLLRIGTRYGLSAALAQEWPGAVEAWGAWMGWMCVISGRWDQQLITYAGLKDLPDNIRLLQHEDLELFELLKRTGRRASHDAPLCWGGEAWRTQLEVLEESTRGSERLGVDPMGEGSVDRRGMDLLGVLEDSLILLVYGKERERELCATSKEMYTRLCAARANRAFAFLDPDPPPLPPVESDGFDPLENREVFNRIAKFAMLWNDALELYRYIRPDGRALKGWERDEVRGQLRAGAVCLRGLVCVAPETPLPTPEDKPDLDLRTAMTLMRKIHRSLILALSERPSWRAQAISLEELRNPPEPGWS